MSKELNYYARHGAALFPIPYGSKAPFGIVPSFKHDHSKSPEQWATWAAAHNCNFGVVAFASGWIIIDIDTASKEGGEEGRAEAWALWSELCQSWGLPGPLAVHCQSARGGWHCYLTVPEGTDASTLRQPDAIKGRINIRCVGFTVAAGSFYDGTAKGEQSGPYLLMSDAPPHPAPAALIQHCTRRAPRIATGTPIGSRDAGDVAELLTWLNERDAFSAYEDWFQIGMALRVEYGDDGFDLWELTHDGTVTPDQAAAKWQSFATEANADSVTLSTFLDRAHKLGWRGTVRRSASAMFHGVATLVANSSAVPITMGRGAAHVRLFTPILEAVPVLPRGPEHPTLPDIGHPLQDAINAAIPAMATGEHTLALAVLNLLHPATAAKVWPVTPLLKAKTAALEAQEIQALAPDAYATDAKGRIQNDNLDNVQFYLNSLAVECRWNEWFEYPEVQGWEWPRWTRVDDSVVNALRMNATKTGTRFVMGKEFAVDSLSRLARQNPVDPACALLDKWQKEWDGTPRLSTWLSRACGVPDNAYHRAVSRVVLLGLVGRIRHPGIKFDLMMVLVSPKQGTEKSSLAKVLALQPDWFIENISLGQDPKELVLLLAGKTVAEVTEMRTRGDVESAKAMITTTHDEGRTAYARFTTRRARRNILVGSTNRPEFLEDDSGNRRFLPVNVVGDIDLAWVRANLPQLIGEAAAGLATCGEEKIELPREVWDIAAEYQEAARARSDYEIHLANWFAGDAAGYISSADLAVLLRDVTGRSIPANQYGKVMRHLGFENKLQRVDKRSPAQTWWRGDGARWTVDRDIKTGRLWPRQMFASVSAMAR